MKPLALIALGLAQATALTAVAAEIPLYPTGPGEDSAFLRFVNAADGKLELVASGSGTRLGLEENGAASAFLTVPAGKPVVGTLSQAGQSAPLEITVQPGEFATVFALPGDGSGLKVVSVAEQPDDFNGLKASLAFFNLDDTCSAAALKVAGRDVAIFKDVAVGSAPRRSINPVNLSVQLSCAGAAVGEPLALGQLAAGERYSVFLVPSKDGSRIFQAQDQLAN